MLTVMMQGIKKTKDRPNPHLYQSLAVLAGDMGFIEEARAWFRQGTATVRVRPTFSVFCPDGGRSVMQCLCRWPGLHKSR